MDSFSQKNTFKHIEDDVRKDFTFKDNWLDPCKEFRSQMGEEVISLHVRRGDPGLADKRGFKWAYVNLAASTSCATS